MWTSPEPVTLKGVPPPRQGAVAPKERPYALHSQDELGAAFAQACRVAMYDWRGRSPSTRLKWTRHDLVEAVLEEFVLRHLEREAELELAHRLACISLAPE